MKTFYATFGDKYRNEPHPVIPEAHPDAYITIKALTLDEAYSKMVDKLSPDFALIYASDKFDPTLYPHGSIAAI